MHLNRSLEWDLGARSIEIVYTAWRKLIGILFLHYHILLYIYHTLLLSTVRYHI